MDVAEKGSFTFTGEVFDTIYHPDGRVEKLEKSYNIVVDSIAKVIAFLMKGGTNDLYWAVGTGDVSWDSAPFSPSPANTQLVNEVFRKKVNSIEYIDSKGLITSSVTNRILVSITLDGTEANGHSIREFGVFGGQVGPTRGSGIMINHKTHSRIDKVEGMIIERSVRFTF